MTQAESEAKGVTEPKADVPKGCVRTAGPDGTTSIIARAPRGPGPWWRVKHPAFGGKIVKAKDADEAVAAFLGEHAPGEVANKTWVAEFRKYARVMKAYD